jgi:hypothetical protein
MLRKALFVGLLAGSGLGGASATVAAGPFFAPEPPTIAGEPFSAEAQAQSTTVFSDGNRIVRTNTVRFFRDTQGRTRVERQMPSGAFVTAVKAGSSGATGTIVPAENRTIVIEDPVANEYITLVPMMKMASVLKYPAGRPPLHGAMSSLVDTSAPFGLLGLGMRLGADGGTTESSADTTSLGQKVINGILATGTRIVRVIPVGALGNEKPITSTLEEWKSAELGIPVQITETSSIGGQLTFNLQNVQRAEPDPSLFTVPSDYTRRDMAAPTAQADMKPIVTFTAGKKP